MAPAPASRPLRWLAVSVSSALGVGFFPLAPGTAGTLIPGVPLAWLVSGRGPSSALVLVALLFAVGCWAAGVYERIFRKRDPSVVVLDEVVGFLITMVGLPRDWHLFLIGFLVFRGLDILKPWPAGLVDRRVPGGLGIMLDDVVAGLYARLILEGIYRFS